MSEVVRTPLLSDAYAIELEWLDHVITPDQAALVIHGEIYGDHREEELRADSTIWRLPGSRGKSYAG